MLETVLDVSEKGSEGRVGVGVGVRIGIRSRETEDARAGCASTIQTEKGHGGRSHQIGFVRVLARVSE